MQSRRVLQEKNLRLLREALLLLSEGAPPAMCEHTMYVITYRKHGGLNNESAQTIGNRCPAVD